MTSPDSITIDFQVNHSRVGTLVEFQERDDKSLTSRAGRRPLVTHISSTVLPEVEDAIDPPTFEDGEHVATAVYESVDDTNPEVRIHD